MSNLIVDNSYRLVIKAIVNGEVRSFEADVQEEPRITTSSTLTTQPMVNGVKVGDHIFREPISISISGSFSLVGNHPTKFDGSSDRLASIERTFETIKNKGIFCTLVTMNRKNNQLTRFMHRNNMILTNINWTEKFDTLDFDFSFKEVILVDVDAVNVEVEDNSDLPDITDAVQGDFTDTFLNKEDVLKVVIQTLSEYDLVNNAFMSYWCSHASKDGALLGLGLAGSAIFGVAIATSIALAGTVGTIPVVGWIAGLGVAVYALGSLIANTIRAHQKAAEAKRLFKIEAFKYDPNASDEQNQQEAKRFTEYLATICNEMDELENSCQVYSIANSIPQEAMLYVDDSYYIFKFTRNNTSNDEVELEVTDVNGAILTTMPIKSSLTDIGQCNKNNRLFTTTSGYDVYLINNALDAFKSGKKDYKSEEEAQADLSNYIILVSQINMEQYANVLKEVTINSMKKAVS